MGKRISNGSIHFNACFASIFCVRKQYHHLVQVFSVSNNRSADQTVGLDMADLQKATINILNVLMHTNQFEELTGITVGTYTDASAVENYITITK